MKYKVLSGYPSPEAGRVHVNVSPDGCIVTGILSYPSRILPSAVAYSPAVISVPDMPKVGNVLPSFVLKGTASTVIRMSSGATNVILLSLLHAQIAAAASNMSGRVKVSDRCLFISDDKLIGRQNYVILY